MNKQAGFTPLELVLTLAVILIVSAGTAAVVAVAFDPSKFKAKSLMQHVKTVESAFALYYSENSYNLTVYNSVEDQLPLNVQALADAGYLKNQQIVRLDFDYLEFDVYNYIALPEISEHARGIIFATDKKSGANYINYYIITGLTKSLAEEFINLCNNDEDFSVTGKNSFNPVTNKKRCVLGREVPGTEWAGLTGEHCRGLTAGCLQGTELQGVYDVFVDGYYQVAYEML